MLLCQVDQPKIVKIANLEIRMQYLNLLTHAPK